MTNFDLETLRLHFHSIPTAKDLTGHRSKVQCVAWSNDGGKLASAGADHSIRIWTMERIALAFQKRQASAGSGSVLIQDSNMPLSQELKGHSRTIQQVSWCPVNSNILASASLDKTVRIWDFSKASPSSLPSASGKEEPRKQRTPKKTKEEPLSQSTTTYEVPSEVITTENENLHLIWHPSEPILCVGSKDDRINIYRLKDVDFSEVELLQSISFSEEVYEFSWSSDGKDFCVALSGGKIEVFKFSGSKLERVRSLIGHTADCFCVRFWGDDLMISGGSDAQIIIWSRAQDYIAFKVFNRMEWPIRALSMSHDGELMAVASEDPFIAIEHVPSGELVAKLPNTLKGGSSSRKTGIPINCLAWHPNRHILVWAGDEIDDRTGKSTGSIKIFGLC